MIKMIRDEFELVGGTYVFRKLKNESLLNYQYFTKYSELGFGHSNSYVSRVYNLSSNQVRQLNHKYKWSERMREYERWFLKKWIKLNFPDDDDGKWLYDSRRTHNLKPWYQQKNELNWLYFCFTIYLLLNKYEYTSIYKSYDYILEKYPYMISRGRKENINKPIKKQTLIQKGTDFNWNERMKAYCK